MTLPDSSPGGRPLAIRLRREAAEWDEGGPMGEPTGPLLLEAAEAIEHLAARVAELEHERRSRAAHTMTSRPWNT